MVRGFSRKNTVNQSIIAKSEKKTEKKTTAQIVENFRDLFFIRTDVIAVKPPAEWNIAVCPMEPDDINQAILSHLQGENVTPAKFRYKGKTHGNLRRIGTYSVFDGKSIWGVIDVDGSSGGKHANPVARPDEAAIVIINKLKELSVPAYLERSGSGTGYHVWVFLSETVPAASIRKFLLSVIPKDIPMLEEGKFADPNKNHGVEVFPKQDIKKPFGNLVWFPFFYEHRESKNSRFYTVTESGIGDHYVPDFVRLDVTRLNELVAAIPEPNLSDTEEESTVTNESPKESVADFAINYLKTKAPPAVQGAQGDQTTFRVACDLVRGLLLEPELALKLMIEHYNPRCKPAWSEHDLRSKIESAKSNGSFQLGYFLKAIGSDWGSPTAVPSVFKLLPKIGKDMVPPSIRPWITDNCERIGCCLEFGMFSYFTLAATLIGRKVAVHPKALDKWLVIPNLWGALVGYPSTKKSPAMDIATEMLQRLDVKSKEAFKKKCAESQEERDGLELEIASLMKEAEKTMKNDRDLGLSILKNAGALKVRLKELEVHEKRRWTSDATTEALMGLFCKNPNGIMQRRDELQGFLAKLDRPNNDGDRAAYLEMWNGNQPFRSDRVSRVGDDVQGMCLTLIGGIQPDVYDKYVEEAISNSEKNDGMIQRFQVTIYPDITEELPYVDRIPDYDAELVALKIIEKLDAMSSDNWGECISSITLSDGSSGEALKQNIPALRFSSDAQEYVTKFLILTAKQAREMEKSCPAYGSHLGKYGSFFASLALIIHLTRWAAGEPVSTKKIDLESTLFALAWVDLCRLHAEKVYARGLSNDVVLARSFAEKIASKQIFDGIQLSQIHQGNWSRLDNAKDVRKAIEYLEGCGWLRVEKADEQWKTKGRPSSPVVRLNPALFTEDGHLRKDLVEDEKKAGASQSVTFKSEWLDLLASNTKSSQVQNVVILDDFRKEHEPQRNLNKELIEACRGSNINLVQQLLDEGADIDGENGQATRVEQTPIYAAILTRKRTLVDFLLEKGVAINLPCAQLAHDLGDEQLGDSISGICMEKIGL